MNKDSILLFTKDAFCTSYLPQYGNQYWKGKTPNIDELCEKGTLFTRFYTAAPSSAMSYLAMFTGKYPYMQKIKRYEPLKETYFGETLFDIANTKGFKTHVVWDESWMPTSYKHSRCYGRNTEIHPLKDLKQGVGFHFIHEGVLQPSPEKEVQVLELIDHEIAKITQGNEKVFVWFHAPHVYNSKVAMGMDVDLHDKVLGLMRKYFSDNCIYFSADHGNMDGAKGKLGYGFDVYEPAIRIPLITPRKNGLKQFDGLVSNIDWDKLIFGGDIIPEREIVLSDCAYYGQEQRKLAVLYRNYRYIYNKATATEELYDIEWDPNQNFNLMPDSTYDIDRHVYDVSRELYFYPSWDDIESIRIKLRTEKDKIWRDISETEKKSLKVYSVLRKSKILSFIMRPFVSLLHKMQ